jgi:hypothetical protein
MADRNCQSGGHTHAAAAQDQLTAALCLRASCIIQQPAEVATDEVVSSILLCASYMLHAAQLQRLQALMQCSLLPSALLPSALLWPFKACC